MSATKYSILVIATVVVSITAIRFVSSLRIAGGNTAPVNQTQTLMDPGARQELESAKAGLLTAMADFQGQLELAPTPVTTQEDRTAASGLLSSILYSERSSSVVIDGEILHEGDVIRDVKVFKIHKDAVELEKNGQKWLQGLGTVFSGKDDSV
jgi:type II secretory pathway component PulC